MPNVRSQISAWLPPRTVGCETEVGAGLSRFFVYRALIAYLYSGYPPFFYLSSGILVGFDAESQPNQSFDSQLKLELQIEFDVSLGDSLYYGVLPCSAHAMYRLADRYGVDELMELSLGFITRSLTVENVAYELFSPLSLDFAAVQEAIFEFFSANWDAVKASKAFGVVIDKFSSGELQPGKELMTSIFQMTSNVSAPTKRRRED
ncbi:uncharacterized protein JCM6883_003048 [Sporobolomyces salmoneus]|uniref:uncharacterized protein n=1 Tax=Sporobolomyces salmoneus TaxID=183962 RepID=UPI0031772CE8